MNHIIVKKTNNLHDNEVMKFNNYDCKIICKEVCIKSDGTYLLIGFGKEFDNNENIILLTSNN